MSILELSGLARIVRAAMAALLLSAIAVTASSCVSLLELDGYQAATSELCEMLHNCFGGDFFPECHRHTEPRLKGAEPDQREEWLVSFADQQCLENCTNARVCLDESPVCRDLGEGCTQPELCCGFILGKGACGPADSCCKPDGTSCMSNADCCNINCIDGFCGGFQCIEAGDDCEEDFECCTKRCEPDGTCADQACAPLQSACAFNVECCSGYCNLGDGTGPGQCQEPPCGPVGSLCEGDDECCSEQCVFNSADVGFCSLGQCLPEGASCDPTNASGDLCCEGSCDPAFFQCRSECQSPNESCNTDGECCNSNCDAGFCACTLDGESCLDHAECCGGVCSELGVCGATCDFSEGLCSHSVCTVGAPLADSCLCNHCEGNSNLPNAVTDCIPSICALQPDCCCVGWGPSCVEAVSVVCGTYCPPP